MMHSATLEEHWALITAPLAGVHESYRAHREDTAQGASSDRESVLEVALYAALWPGHVQFTERDLSVPASLIGLLRLPAEKLRYASRALATMRYAMAIRKLIRRREQEYVRERIGRREWDLVIGTAPELVDDLGIAQFDQSFVTTRRETIDLELNADGAVMLSECCAAFGSAWRLCLKFRLPRALGESIDAAVPLDVDLAVKRLAWVGEVVSDAVPV